MPKQGHNTTEIDIPESKEEEIDLDDYERGDYLEPEIEPDYTQQGEQVKKMSSKVNLSRNGMLIAIGIVIVIIVIVLFTGKLPIPKLGSLTEGGSGEGGTASGLLSSYDEAADGSSEGGEKGGDGIDDITTLIIKDLRDYYPTYDIKRNEELQQIEAVGTMEDGQSHKMIFDYNGEIIEEVIGNSEVADDGTLVERTPEPQSTEGADTVQVPLSEYNKYHISKKQQTFVQETQTDESTFAPSVTTTNERLIVEYERLPIKGSTPLVYSKVLETGEEIIFSVTLRQYANLGEKGTTVIQVTRSEGYGVKAIDQVTLVKWQD